MRKVDATMVLRRDGVFWYEAHWMESTSLDDPPTEYNVVNIRDGSEEQPPTILWMMLPTMWREFNAERIGS